MHVSPGAQKEALKTAQVSPQLSLELLENESLTDISNYRLATEEELVPEVNSHVRQAPRFVEAKPSLGMLPSLFILARELLL